MGGSAGGSMAAAGALPAGGGGAAAGMAGQGGSATAGVGGTGSGGVAGVAGASGGGGEGGAPGPLVLSSSAFQPGAGIDLKFRCTGENVSPALSWTRGPLGTLSYAVTMIHVGSQSLHWVLWDIPADVRALSEGVPRVAEPAMPQGTKQVETNIDGATWAGYTGPCPGSANQSYTFFVYALDIATLPGVTPASSAVQADAAVKQHQLEVAELTGTASKQ